MGEELDELPALDSHEKQHEVENGDNHDHEVPGKQNGKLVPQPEAEEDECGGKVENLDIKLKLALKEITNKDNLVKQHAKVAEDAISGWEKAEAEAASFKQQLDNALQQKLILEEKVSHLDGALKECVKQMRSGKEEHEELLNKSKEWDTLRLDLEAKLEEANQRAADNVAAADALRQRISSLSDSSSQAQAEAKKTTAKVEALDKENSTLRHDLRNLKKELVALNGEAKTAKQQNAEAGKKVSKLEAECLKLKGMLRKRATGASQVRQDVDVLDRDARRKSFGRLTASPRACESVEDASEAGTRETDEKLFALEEEAKTLKQVIERKDKELQAARLMCAKTANKLTVVEEQLATMSGGQLAGLNGQIETLRAFGKNQPSSIASHGSANGDEADAWAAALVAELSPLKKEKDGSKPDKLLDTTSFELMDDFLEMEKLTSNLPHENGHMWVNKEMTNREGSPDSSGLETALADKEKELANANEMCKGLEEKVADLEKRLYTFPSTNGCNSHEAESNGVYTDHNQGDLSPVISQVLSAIEALSKEAGLRDQELQQSGSDDDDADPALIFKKVAMTGKRLMQGEADVQQFMMDVRSALEVLRALWESSKESSSEKAIELQQAENQLKAELELIKADRSAVNLEEIQRVQETLYAVQVEKELLAGRISDLEAQIKTTTLEREAADSTAQKLAEDLSRVTSERDAAEEALRQDIEKMKTELAGMVSDRDRLTEALEGKTNKLAELVEELGVQRRASMDSITAVNVDVEKMVIESAQLKYEKQRLEKALGVAKEQLQEEACTLGAHIETLEEDLRKALVEKEASQHLVEELKEQLARLTLLEDEVKKLGTEKEAAEQLCTNLNGECARLASEKHEREEKLSAANEELERVRNKLSSMEEEFQSLEVRHEKLEHRLNQSEENVKTQQESFISLQNEYYQMKIEKEDMEQSLAVSEQRTQQLQCTLDEDKKSKERSTIHYEERLELLVAEKEMLRVKIAASQKHIEQMEADWKLEKEKLSEELFSSTKALDEELKAAAFERTQLNDELLESENTVEKLEATLRSVQEDGEAKLRAAHERVKHLEEECSQLKVEKFDLEEVLASTNEMVQGVKTECSNLSDAAEELKSLKAEKVELEQLLRAAHESIESITAEIKKLEAEKAEVEHDLALSQVRWRSQVFEAEELVASLRAELGLAMKSKQLAEEQLEESFSEKASLQYQVKAALHEANQLEERARNLEAELGKERQASKEALSQLEGESRQLSWKAENESERNAFSMARAGEQGVDVAAKLDECHRAILSLGQQLQSLTASKTSPSMTEQTSSEESINNTNALLAKEEIADTNSLAGANGKSPEHETPRSSAAISTSTPIAPDVSTPPAGTTPVATPVATPPASEAGESNVFVPSIPLEGRPRSKSMSPAKPKTSRTPSNSSADLTKSLDMGSSEKPSSSSAFSRFFRGKHHHHH